jgi:hypothetical protein
MTDNVKDRLRKIYELVERGVDGEKDAAKAALDKLMKKYNITEDQLNNLSLNEYPFKWSTDMEMWLLQQIMIVFVGSEIIKSLRRKTWKKEVHATLTYEHWVTIECAYEYFRRHMKAEWKRIVLPELQKCRKEKTKARKRKEMKDLFFSQYCIASKLYQQEQLTQVNVTSNAEREKRMKLQKVQGGQYNKQVHTNYLLEI